MYERLLLEAQSRHDISAFLAYIFMVLPTAEYVDRLAVLDVQDDDSQELKQMIAFIKSCESTDEVLQSILLDRTQLLRGTQRDGAKPPYESLYRRIHQSVLFSDLYTFYRDAGIMLTEEAHTTPDFLGSEIAFIEAVSQKEIEALHAGDSTEANRLRGIQEKFFSQHLSSWLEDVSAEIDAHAQTDFFKGVAALLREYSTSNNAGEDMD